MIKGKRAGDNPIGINVLEGKSYYWCACGLSKKQPFCDGSHSGTEFKPLPYKALETKKMFFKLLLSTNSLRRAGVPFERMPSL